VLKRKYIIEIEENLLTIEIFYSYVLLSDYLDAREQFTDFWKRNAVGLMSALERL
jgi:hypothetical protein